MVYGCQTWGQRGGSHIEKIIKLQNRAIRIINFEDFHANPNPLYINNGILKLQGFIRLQNCLFVHDFLHNSQPGCFDDHYFKLNYLHFTTCKPEMQISITQKSINGWNSITKCLEKDYLASHATT